MGRSRATRCPFVRFQVDAIRDSALAKGEEEWLALTLLNIGELLERPTDYSRRISRCRLPTREHEGSHPCQQQCSLF
jgi:hypothetical protein